MVSQKIWDLSLDFWGKKKDKSPIILENFVIQYKLCSEHLRKCNFEPKKIVCALQNNFCEIMHKNGEDFLFVALYGLKERIVGINLNFGVKMDKIKVLLVEDQDLLLDGMSLSLQTGGEIEVVGKFKDIADYFTFDGKNDVDVVLSDVCCANNHNSIDFVKDIKRDNPKVKIVLMTSVMEINFVDRARKAGVDSFVYKTIPTKELITVIHNVMNGYSTFPLSKREEIACLKDLTDNELNIIRLYCQGNNRKEIAQKLTFSESTIKNNITLILEKTGFASMSKFAIWLMQNGFIV